MATISQNLNSLSTILLDSFSKCEEHGTTYTGIKSYTTLSSAVDDLPRQNTFGTILGYDKTTDNSTIICDAEKIIAYAFSSIDTISAVQFTKLTAININAFTGNSSISLIWFPFITQETEARISASSPWGATNAKVIYNDRG